MNQKNQVCTKEQALKLKELGVSQETLWSYFKCPSHAGLCLTEMSVRHVWILTGNPYDDEDIEITAAFTVAELGVMLGPLAHYPQHSDRNDYWYIYLDKYEQFKTEAEVRAATLIYRLEKGAITAAEVNHLLLNA